MLATTLACSVQNPYFLVMDADGDADAGASTSRGDGEVAAAASGHGDETTGDALTATSSGSTGGGGTSGDEPGEGGASSTGDDGSTADVGACAGACGAPGCGACPDGEMVEFPGFRIDALETSNAAYRQFLAAGVDPATQPAVCGWNVDFTPAQWPVPALADPLPVVGVDWCDAHAYCAWAGKRLCGAIGGGSSSARGAFDAAADQWYRACSGADGEVYPYGPTYVPVACNGADAGVGGLLPGMALATCQGSLPGLFDMSGNVWEWVDACDGEAGPGDACMRRGGSFFSVPKDLRCDLLSTRSRETRLDHVGIRCCAE